MKNKFLILSLLASSVLLGQTNFNNPPPPPPTSGSGIAVGGDGSATYYFWVVAKYTGGDSLAYGPIIVSNAPSPGSLSLFQFVRVNWGAVAGVTGYDLLRTATGERPTGACNCVVSAAQVGTQFDLVTSSVSAYTVNPAGSTYARIFLESYAYTSPRLRQDVNGVESDIGAGGGGSGSLTDLLDVTISGVSTGQFLRKSAGDWVNAAIAQSDVTGLPAALSALAPLASPTFTGTPAAPTASPGTNTTQVATTAFVTAAVAAGGGGGSVSAPYVKTVTAVTTDTILASTHSMGTTPLAFCFDNASPDPNQVSCGTPKLASNGDLSFTFSPAFTGTIRVYAQFATGGGGGNYQSIRVDSGTAVTGRARINFISGPGMAVTATDDSGNNETDVEISAIPDVVTIGGTQTLTNKSLTSPALTGTPTTPTASPGTNTTQVASTAFVTAAVAAGGGGATDLNGLSDVVITSSASGDTLVHNGSNYVNRPMVVADIAGAAPTASPALTGSPTAPTPALSSNSTAIATTAWVLTRNVAPELGFSCIDEFLGTALSASLPIGSCGWNTAASGTSAAVSLGNAEATAPGLVNMTTGTTTTGTSTLSTRNLSILFGAVKFTFKGRIRIPTLSDATDTFTSVAGFIDGASGSVVDGCFLSYSHGVNSGRFQENCHSNSVTTTADSGISVVAGTWYTLSVEVNAAASSAEFFIDGTSVGTITTNIPSGSGRQTGSGVSITKSAGTSARTTDIDNLALQINR